MTKKLTMLYFLALLVLYSCAIFDSPGKYTSFEKNIKLLTKEDRKEHSDNRFISILQKGKYELIIPITYFMNFKFYNNDKAFLEYCTQISSVIQNSQPGEIISKGDLSYKDRKHGTRLLDLLESGRYYIINIETGGYVEEVELKWERCYAGPLAASFDATLKIGNFILWETHDIS
jgi:hypothetical protein